ncbi:LEA type 2 family protein [Methanoplanus endosymbiosus]|uniref:LEA type 2 family protein n=1 Tax=Methanoplanus endosymbiosus TaxID=33865 RepID=A0A9E7TGL0_9EURY|nr:LEA type 2 family protein [Methanoplanus endosymbiosus]UUX91332.1 LEA type 2 family protein [Methanoplanus endosymbiosus]
MNEKNLKIILAAFPVVIIIIAVIIPLYTTGWDFEKALYGTDPTAVIESFEMKGQDMTGGYFTPQNYTLSDDGGSLTLTGIMKNPYSEDITITKLGYSIIIGGDPAELKLTRSVVIPASGTGEVVLSAPVSESQLSSLTSGEKVAYGDSPLSDMAIDMSGIKVVSEGK